MKDKLILCVSTAPDEATGRRIARHLVEHRLAACVNRLPGAVSTYRWEGSVEEDQEEVLLIKTRADRLDTLAATIRALHPYELPEVVAVPLAGGLDDYLAWIAASCASAPTKD